MTCFEHLCHTGAALVVLAFCWPFTPFSQGARDIFVFWGGLLLFSPTQRTLPPVLSGATQRPASGRPWEARGRAWGRN
jgi:hypothetical protein